MKIEYETAYRPNFELYAAMWWLGTSALLFLFSVYLIHLPMFHSLFCVAITLVMAMYRGAQAMSWKRRRVALDSTPLEFIQLPALTKKMPKDGFYLGSGFDWTAKHTQRLADLMAQDDEIDRIRQRGKGGTWLHGVNPGKDGSVTITDDESKGHVFIVGTTGAGKTRLLDLLVSQSIFRGQATIIIDPKGDKELAQNALNAFSEVRSPEDFVYFHPAHPGSSVAIDPLGNYNRPSELATRVANCMPQSDTEVFRAFSQMSISAVIYATLIGQRTPTIADMLEPLTSGVDGLLATAIRNWAAERVPTEVAAFPKIDNLSPEAAAMEAVTFYREQLDKGVLRDIDLQNLIGQWEHDKAHFSKMIASLIPVITQLSSAPLDKLLSSREGRMPETNRRVNLRQVIESGGCAYIGLDTLSDSIVGRSIGQLMLADLAAIAGTRYNHSSLEKAPFVNVFVDEASEVATEQLIQLLNKGRGAKFRLFVATQTLADFTARLGDESFTEMITGNLNTSIILRSIKPEVQKAITDAMHEVPVYYIMRTVGTSLGEDAINAEFSSNMGERLMHERLPIIPPQALGDLPNLQYFLKTPTGRLVKGKLPILEATPGLTPEAISGERRPIELGATYEEPRTGYGDFGRAA